MSFPERFPGADFRSLGAQTEPKMTAHDIVCLHTMVGSLASTDALFHQDGYGGTEAHFGVGARGEVVQWQELSFTADANLDGNHHVISIETADTGGPFPAWTGSNVPAWTRAQVDAIVELTAWLCRKFDIPAKLIPDTKPGRRGIGYHRQGIEGSFSDGLKPGGERWSDSTGKVCPGDRRIRQLKRTVVPKVRAVLHDPHLVEDVDPAISLTRVRRASSADVVPAVRVVERALVAEGLLDESRADGVWGPATSLAYAAWQRKLGFSGADADGSPGEESLARLGDKHGFRVRAVDD